jgi:LPXTG-motif cell wall-anchored protein
MPEGTKPKAPATAWDQLKNKPVLIGIGSAAVALVLGLGFFLRKRKRGKAELVAAAALPAAAEEYDRVALAHGAREDNGQDRKQGSALQLPPARAEVITAQLRESVSRDAELWAGVLRAWLSEEEKA